MKLYYAIFTKTQNAVEAEFPDLPGCVTFGDNFEEAYENAKDVLAGWLANAEKQFIKQPSRYDDLKESAGEIVPIPLDENILNSYAKTKRISIIFPAAVIEKADRFRKSAGLNRSALLMKAVQEYMENHSV
jgi:predicted RNase H-like HicB family nuclease